MNYKFLLLSIIIICLWFGSCKKDKPPVAPDNNINNITVSGQALKGVFVCNEGNFNSGTASISFLDQQNQFVADLFRNQNNFGIGDVAQSIHHFNGNFYIVVNNSGKIVVVDDKDFKQKAVINGLTSPRYMVNIGSKGYVSDLYSNEIKILNLDNNSVIGRINCSGWTEEMIVIGSEIFVTNMRRDKIYVVNSISDQITDSITVSQATSGIVKDKNGKLWVLCGDAANNISSALGKINPSTKTLEILLQYPNGINAGKIKMNSNGDEIHLLDNTGIKKMNITDLAIPVNNVISGSNHNFYQLSIDPLTEIIHVSDALDYVQRGYLYRYDPLRFTVIDSFRTGIIPGYIYFNK